MDAEGLSESLRTGSGLYLACRRGIVLTSFVAGLCMMGIGLYQFGILKGLPEPPLPRMDAERVDAAPQAYRPFGLTMPDAFLGLLSYAATAALAVLAGPQRFERLAWIPLLLLAKVLVDAVQAGRLTWSQWTDHQAFCFWCLVAAAASFVALPLAIPEAIAAGRALRD